MNIKIIINPFNVDVYGFSGIALNKDYAGTAFRLSGKMWEIVKSHGLKNKGMNIWVYEANDSVFAGVELNDEPESTAGLEHKSISLQKYAYYKHIGPYKLIKQTGINMQNELTNRGLATVLPYIEIYGHWTNDENKSATELLMSLQ